MRKIIYFTLFIITLFAINFILWFIHNRTINESLHTLKKQLAVYKIDFTYEDVYYRSFKAWDVRGVVKNVKLKYNSKDQTSIVLDEVIINSKPYKEHLELTSSGKILLSKKIRGIENVYEVIFDNGTPSIEVKFSTSLNRLAEDFEGDYSPSLFQNVETIKYYDSGFELIDIINKTKLAKVGKNKISISHLVNKMFKRYDIEAHFQDFALYEGNNDQELISWENTFDLEASFVRKPSNSRLEFIENLKKQGKPYKSRVGFDSFQIIFNKLDFTSENVTSSVRGIIDRQPTGGLIPYMNLTLSLDNYSKWLDSYFKKMNESINDMLIDNPLLPIEPVSIYQIKEFKKFISKFSQDGSNISIRLHKSDDEGFNISGMPFEHVVAEVQAIFFSNFKDSTKKIKNKRDKPSSRRLDGRK